MSAHLLDLFACNVWRLPVSPPCPGRSSGSVEDAKRGKLMLQLRRGFLRQLKDFAPQFLEVASTTVGLGCLRISIALLDC